MAAGEPQDLRSSSCPGTTAPPHKQDA